MAHFAKVENGIVVNVIVLKNDDCGGGSFPNSEPIGQKFIETIGFSGVWLQTSYNKNFRGNFAGKGMIYNNEKDCFHNKKPFDSWELDNNGNWNPPIPIPDDEFKYKWNEETNSWDKIDN